MKLLLLITMLVAIFTSSSCFADSTKVKLITSEGDIVVELDAKAAPKTVANFLEYVKSGFYSGTIFHRVIQDFMIQGGGFDANYEQKPTKSTVVNESSNGLKNVQYSIAMARKNDPDSATCQFFINTKDNTDLDFPHAGGSGYTVFGKVVEGKKVVDALNVVPTGPAGPFGSDVPKKTVTIKSAELLKKKK